MTSDSEVFRRRNCCGMTEHCLAWRRSHCPDKVDDIYAVRKSSTDQCNSSGQLFCGSMKKISLFQFQETPSLAISYFENRDFEWYSRSGEMSLFFGTVKIDFTSVLTSASISVTSWVTWLAWQVRKVQTVLYPTAKTILPIRLLHVFVLRQKIGDVLWASRYKVTGSTLPGYTETKMQIC